MCTIKNEREPKWANIHFRIRTWLDIELIFTSNKRKFLLLAYVRPKRRLYEKPYKCVLVPTPFFYPCIYLLCLKSYHLIYVYRWGLGPIVGVKISFKHDIFGTFLSSCLWRKRWRDFAQESATFGIARYMPSKAFSYIYAIGFCQPRETRAGVTRTFDAGANEVNVDAGIMFSTNSADLVRV